MSETVAGAPARVWLRWSLLIPIAVAVLGYLWVLDGWFLYDDFTQGYLLEHDAPWIDGNWLPILQDFGRAQFGIEDWVYYRAMMSVYLTGCLELLDVDPVKLHAVNLVHHAILTGMVAFLCALYCDRHPHLAAICGGSWFAMHPVGVEAIAWFSANTVTFELLGRLGAIVAFAVHVRTNGRVSLVLAMVLAAIGLLTKESGINVVLGLVAVHALRRPTPSLGELIRKHLPFVPIWIGYFLLRYFALGMFFAGSKGSAGSFFDAVPINGPIQAKLVFLPFGGALPNGVLLVLGAALLVWALLRGFSSRSSLWVLFVGLLWLASQFVPTALNHVFPNLGSSRAHYGTLAGAALWITVLVFGRKSDGPQWIGWAGAALFAATVLAFFPVRNVRQERFEEAWEENRKIHAQLRAFGESAAPERPVGVVWTPYTKDGVPQLNRTAHFTLCEVPFTKKDLPVVGLTTMLVHGGIIDWVTAGKGEAALDWPMKHDPSPHRALLELGGTLVTWLPDQQKFLRQEPSAERPLPALARAPGGPSGFAFAEPVMPDEIDGFTLEATGRPTGGTLDIDGHQIAFGTGSEIDGGRKFTIDVTHDFPLWLKSVSGGIRSIDVRLDGDAQARIVALRPLARLPVLPLVRKLRGSEVVFGEEHESLTAPSVTDPEQQLRLVLLTPSEPIEVPEVQAGQPVRLPKRLRSEMTRLLRLSRQKRFYYYFETRSPSGKATGAARSPVDWFRLVPKKRT